MKTNTEPYCLLEMECSPDGTISEPRFSIHNGEELFKPFTYKQAEAVMIAIEVAIKKFHQGNK